MNKLSFEQIMKAYQLWLFKFPQPKIDQDLSPFLAPEIKPFPYEGWLQRVRQARLLSAMEVAKRLGLHRSTYLRLEASETEGRLSLGKLSELANAMDCELVYALRPKNRTPLAFQIFSKLLPEATQHSWVRTRPQSRKVAALVAICRKLETNSEFRKSQGWTERKTRS